jgi:hypothetical protein
MQINLFRFLIPLFFIFCITSSVAQTTDSISSYNSIHYRGSAEIAINEQTYNCQYNFVNVIDSFLYIQLNVGPIEAGRALITPDKILYINKLQKNYYEGDYSFFQKLLDIDIDFYAIQAIFNGFPVSVPEDVELLYQGKSVHDKYLFFDFLTCESEDYALKLEVKKVTFNDVPKVSAAVPKNYSAIKHADDADY